MITARTWLVPWASRGESAYTNGEDAECDQSRQNGYAVEGMQHQSKEHQQSVAVRTTAASGRRNWHRRRETRILVEWYREFH
ncbi:hypothetical protein LA080_012060 [Diaporthe eres]|nr:hypothetical protein LA080_012060 [Diaporthe eres]